MLLVSIGTRGDMEPFLAIGEMLKQKGHEVICLFPEQFRNLAEDSDMRFASLGSEFMEMLESDVGKFALGGGGSKWTKILAYAKLAKMQYKNNKLMITKQHDVVAQEKPDRIIHNGKAMYPVIWEASNQGKTIYVSPVPYLHYVKHHTHIAFNSNYREFLNKLTYKLADWGLVKTIMTSVKWLKISDIRKSQIIKVLENHKIIYTISPQLFAKPPYWKENITVLGYHERNKTLNWKPSRELLVFLEKHKKCILITFGSMTNPEPEEKTRIILDILKRNRIPAIINISSGGLVEPNSYDKDLIHFVSGIPYDWIFPKMYAVIHHGGSGTTHMALKYGCATMIIPHIIDQFVWNKIVDKKGVGPKGIKISKITTMNLESKVLELVNNSPFKQKAKQIAKQMEKEDYKEELYNSIVK